MDCEDRSVHIERIDREDPTYLITTGGDDTALAWSIGMIGLLHQPLMQQKEDGRYRIVSGFRRVAACAGLGWAKIPSRVLAQGVSGQTAALAAVCENAAQRPLNLIEQSRAVALLAPGAPWSERLPLVQKALGLPASCRFLEQIEGLCALPLPVQQAVMEGVVSLPMALRLGELPEQEAGAFTRLFADLGLSLGKQREVLDRVQEIGRREGRTTVEVLEDREVRQILGGGEPDRNRKTAELRSLLNKRRFPEISAARERFTQQVGSLPLTEGMQLAAPPHFEGDVYTMKLDFRSPEELEARRRALEAVVRHPALREMLSG